MDHLCEPVHIKGSITARGVVNSRFAINTDMVDAITVKIDDKPISVVVEGGIFKLHRFIAIQGFQYQCRRL
ncbi:hypothetical protein RWE15_03465 [Virgibacillus halophilus]|uniref:Uncharacterized protein n=1 Tax=Tigheibacillus halophilus TaxID=361280 RepID=A0ABU5C471_9BACI|nr:hypothetical protein [Virgibacillus halophilus]